MNMGKKIKGNLAVYFSKKNTIQFDRVLKKIKGILEK